MSIITSSGRGRWEREKDRETATERVRVMGRVGNGSVDVMREEEGR